jgi:hypothetical protein
MRIGLTLYLLLALTTSIVSLPLSLHLDTIHKPIVLKRQEGMLDMEERGKARMEVLNLHSIYLLYWYKSTNTDAEARSLLHHYLQHLHLPTKFKERE